MSALRSFAIGGAFVLSGCVSTPPAGTGDLGVVIERANGTVAVINTTERRVMGEVPGLGDLSHASVVFSRDGLYAYVFGRDGALSKVNMLTRRIEARTQQAGNSIGGAISQDGRYVAAQNYVPGGVKIFDARTLALVADVPAVVDGKASRVVGLADLPGGRFVFSLFDAGQIWLVDMQAGIDPAQPKVTRFADAGKQPYDGLVTPNGRYYIAGLFGEDGLALIDLWDETPSVRKVLSGYGRGETPLPVFKMPHLRGWAIAGRHAYLPAVGRHEVLVVDTETWREVDRIKVAGQPVFVIARPDGRQVWVTFAVPDYDRVQVIDTRSRQVVRTLEPGAAVLHMEFTPRGEAVWISSRDAHRVSVFDTERFATLGVLDLPSPSGVFFTARSTRIGF
jgi:protein NirF